MISQGSSFRFILISWSRFCLEEDDLIRLKMNLTINCHVFLSAPHLIILLSSQSLFHHLLSIDFLLISSGNVLNVLQLRQEKCELEVTLEKEQEYQVNKLMRRIEKLQAEVVSKQATLEQVRNSFETKCSHPYYFQECLWLSFNILDSNLRIIWQDL